MLRVFKTILRHTDDQARCPSPHRCVPSLPESASCLEDRVLLSAAGGKAHAAEMAQNPADTKAGKEVTNLFESILQTNPTGAQLTRLVHEMRGGLSVKALRKDLTAQARAQWGVPAPASMNDVTVQGGSRASAGASTTSAAAGTMNQLSIMQGLSAPTDNIVSPVHVSQMPLGMSISISFAPAAAPTMSSPTPTPTASPTPTPTPTPSPTPVMSPPSTMPVWM
jgi:hypothetical protein